MAGNKKRKNRGSIDKLVRTLSDNGWLLNDKASSWSSKLLLILAISIILLSVFQAITMISITGKVVKVTEGAGSLDEQGIVELTLAGPPPDYITACDHINLTTNFGRWNYVSSPIYLVNNAIKQALFAIDGSYDWVFEYGHSDGEFDFYYATFDIGTFTEIYSSNCYIIKATQNDTLLFNGTAKLTTMNKNLTTNFGRWNYMGWVNESTGITTALNSVDGEYDWVFRYDHSVGEFDFYYATFDIGTFSNFYPCECYIVKATTNTTLNYTMS